jgi:ABC-type phosphate transport system substrate-binding protein
MKVDYAGVGSTTGRQEFAQLITDFGASEIPYGVRDGNNYDPPPSRGYAYMPDTAGGTTFMYNLKIGATRVTNLRLSGAAIAGIFTGVITNWDDPTIKADNPGLSMPNLKIVPVVRSDGSGATAQFTQWMIATQGQAWPNYCQKVGRNPCTQTSAYPVLPGSAMVGQPLDNGVAGYVSQQQADGAIGYVEYSYAKATGFPVAKVLNAAGYYTEPTPGHVAVSLLQAQINMDQSNPAVYLTQDLSKVYSDPDPRTYELSSYSYMILPTDTTGHGWTSAKGNTLGAFGSYLLCQGQTQVDILGYSALPINLVLAAYAQLQRIPGNQVPTSSVAQIQGCHNPTFDTTDTLGHNLLAETDPYPAACDKQGPTQCTTGTGGATTSTPVNSSAAGNQPGSGAGSSSPGASTAASNGSGPGGCDPNTGVCSGAGSGSQAGPQQVAGVPTASAASLGDGLRVTLMGLAAALLLGLALLPPVIAQASRRRRQRLAARYGSKGVPE